MPLQFNSQTIGVICFCFCHILQNTKFFKYLILNFELISFHSGLLVTLCPLSHTFLFFFMVRHVICQCRKSTSVTKTSNDTAKLNAAIVNMIIIIIIKCLHCCDFNTDFYFYFIIILKISFTCDDTTYQPITMLCFA